MTLRNIRKYKSLLEKGPKELSFADKPRLNVSAELWKATWTLNKQNNGVSSAYDF